MITIGYAGYAIALFLLTGLLILIIDVKGYSTRKMEKEKKAARFIGWLNVSLGVLAFMANWAYQNWFW